MDPPKNMETRWDERVTTTTTTISAVTAVVFNYSVLVLKVHCKQVLCHKQVLFCFVSCHYCSTNFSIYNFGFNISYICI